MLRFMFIIALVFMFILFSCTEVKNHMDNYIYLDIYQHIESWNVPSLLEGVRIVARWPAPRSAHRFSRCAWRLWYESQAAGKLLDARNTEL